MLLSQFPLAIQQLAKYPQWVAWLYQQDEKGNLKKPPINPNNGDMARPNDPKTWGTWEQAVDCAKINDLDGIGFMFHPESMAIVGIDIDDCIDEAGELSKFARETVESIPGYWEISPSGKGLHALVLGTLPEGRRKHPKLGFEMYERDRYFTVTGNQLPSSVDELVDCTDELATLHAMIFGSGAPIAPDRPQKQQAYISDDDILNKAMNAKNGAKFRALWEGNGPHGSPSENDMALMGMLAFWCDQDEGAMDRLFRRSALMRPKWDEMHGENATYGQMTIEKAIMGSQKYKAKTYDVPIVATTAPIDLSRKQNVNTGGGIFLVGDEGDKYPLDDENNYLLNGENWSDDGNARCVIEWLAKKHGQHFVYTKHMGWLYWTGTHWENEDAELRAMKGVLSTILARRKAAVEKESEKGVKAFKPSNALINSTMGLLKILANANILEFDNDPDKLNVKNGVIDLRTGKLLPHDPKQRFTYCVPIEYVHGAKSTAWKNHVYKTFIPECHLGDSMGELAISGKAGDKMTDYLELITYIQTALGYTLTGRASEEIMFYIWGETRSGKGTLFHVLSTLLGKPFAMTAMLSSLTRKRTGNDQNFDLAPLKPARFLTVSETDNSSRSNLNEATVKGMTGQDPIRCCMKGKDHFEYVPVFKIWMASNYAIKANADDHALWQRVKVLHTPNSFAGREDTQLKNKLLSKENLQGVLAWLVEGAKIWYHFYDQGKKLPTPEMVKQATDMARNDNDVLGLFIEECCTVGNDKETGKPHKIPVLTFAKAYTEWCTENMYTPKMARALNEAMKRKGFVYKTGRANDEHDPLERLTKCWEGITIISAKLEY